MDANRARELLARERERIVQGLRGLEPVHGKPTTTDQHMADQGSELYDNELDEGVSDELRAELAALERAEQRLAAGTYGLSIEAANRSPTSASKPCRPPSVPPNSKHVWSAARSSIFG